MSFDLGIWSHSCLIQVSSCWRVCDRLWQMFCLMMCQVFSTGEKSGLQTGQFSTRTLLLWSHAVIIAAVCAFALSCSNTQGPPWNIHHLEGSICCYKTFKYLSAFIVPSETCKLPIIVWTYTPLYHQRGWLLNWMLITRWKVSLLFSLEDTVSVISNNVKFGLVWL